MLNFSKLGFFVYRLVNFASNCNQTFLMDIALI